MKTSLARITCMAFILVFSFGCGKDSSKGGNNGATTYTLGSAYTGSGATAQAQASFSELLSWYDSGTEGKTLGQGKGFSKATFAINSSNSSNCTTKKVLGISFQYCSMNNNNSNTSTPITGSTITTCTGNYAGSFAAVAGTGFQATNYNQYECLYTATPVAYDRSQNAELVQALTAISNNSLQLLDVQKSGTTYYVFVGSSNGFSNSSAAKVYVFDTSIHSIYQPLQIQDLSAGQVKGMYQYL